VKNKKRVTIIETTLVPLEALRKLFAEILPEVDLVSMVDDSLVKEMHESGRVTPAVVRRYCKLAIEAETIGSCLIFNQCSSISEVVDIAEKMVNVPILKQDQAMAEEAVKIGTKIGVVATAASTIGPTSRLIRKIASVEGKKVELLIKDCAGAFALISRGDIEGHDRKVKQAVFNLEKEADVIVLAQGSMATLLPELKDVSKPILTSPRSGVLRAKEILEKM
jgi:Asp/Glu/hydantoin racemase